MATGLGYTLRDGDWTRLRQIIQQLSGHAGPDAEPTYAGLTLTDLTASLLVGTDASQTLKSITPSAVNFTFDAAAGTLDTIQEISPAATPQFARLGVATAASSTVLISATDSITSNIVTGMFGAVTGSYADGNSTNVRGLSFGSIYQPTGALAARACGTMYGAESYCNIVADGTQNVSAQKVSVFNALIAVSNTSTGAASISTSGKIVGWGRCFAAEAATLSGGSSSILNLASFGEIAAQTVATANWGLYILTTNSCVNKLRVGGITAPSATLDVTGTIAGSSTIEAATGFKCGGTAAVADGTYTMGLGGTQNGTITTKGGLVVAVQQVIA